MRVIGTAGHVDHGKSTLIAALTGIHPDRLKEEKLREMTIELGFAWMTLPDGETIGIVDVPGHRDFIENMLAGVGGIDAALLIIAADEGVMPQTREHLAILDLLQIQSGLIVMTKTDLIEDPDWLDLVQADILDVVEGTVLENAPVVRVSARTREGLDLLVQELTTVLDGCAERPNLGRPRLPVDRVFTMPGFGTVVTGTLADGEFHVGEEVEILPGGQHGRIRGLQMHKRKEEMIGPGSRTAVNISGVDVDQVLRGNTITFPGKYQESRYLDVQFKYLADLSVPLKHNTEVKLFIATSEVLARIRLLGNEELQPGELGWLQLELKEPVVAVRGDHYILRRPSPAETLGGGIVVDPHPQMRHKRFSDAVLGRLQGLVQGTPDEILSQTLSLLGAVPLRDAVSKSRLSMEQAKQALDALLGNQQIIVLDDANISPQSDALIVLRAPYNEEVRRLLQVVGTYHQINPLRGGIPREELKSRSKLPPRVINAYLKSCVAHGQLIDNGTYLRLPDHEIKFTPQQNAQVGQLLRLFEESPYAPPTVKDIQARVGEEVANAMLEIGLFVAVSTDVVFRKSDYEQIVAVVREYIQRNGSITVAEFRDRFTTSRRYALAVLEHLDNIGVTVRDGDYRKLRSGV